MGLPDGQQGTRKPREMNIVVRNSGKFETSELEILTGL